MADYPYTSDIGVSSIPYLEAIANSSGVKLSVGSTYRPGDAGLHGKQNAVDFFGSTEAMRQVALYLKQYAPYFLELIHTNPTIPGGGVYVKNGVVVPQSYYNGPDITTGGNIIEGHRDHIHAAATRSALIAAALQNKGKGGGDGQSPSSPPASSNLDDVLTAGLASKPQNKGCMAPAAATALLVIGGPLSAIATLFI